ncbi:MAG: hypothetical protein C0180_01650 [Aciduliprofundum sp.]|nr:MAG: hypothetical protein C0180_01650 [Aciduliprofundum sp.]
MRMVYKETRLEKGIPTKEINEISRKEKLGRAPIFEMHYYWARKPLITNRAVIFGVLSHSIDVEEFKKIVGLGVNKKNEQVFKSTPWVTQKEIFDKIKKDMQELYDDRVLVLDPFAGTGMIPFEALRIGLDVEAIDYNPIAFLIMKGTLEYPKKYGEMLLRGGEINGRRVPSFEEVANNIISEMEKELGYLYPDHGGKKVLTYIWTFKAKCNTCGKYTPVMPDFTIQKNKNGNLYLKPIITVDDVKFEISEEEPDMEPFKSKGIEVRCAHCGRIITKKELLKQFQNGEIIEVPVALYVTDGKERKFDIPDAEDLRVLENAKKHFTPDLFNFIPLEEPSPAVVAKNWLGSWSNFYNPRQLLLMATLSKKIKEKTEELYRIDPDYATAVGTYLAMLLGKQLDYSSRITGWLQSMNMIGHSMALRGLGMTWRYAEPNPFSKSSGSLRNQLRDIVEGIKFSFNELSTSKGNIVIKRDSVISFKPDKKYKLIITDPPYGNDVAYGDFSDYFYVWESRAVGHLFGWGSTVTEKDEEIDVNDKDRGWEVFWDRFGMAIKKIYEILDEDGLFVAYFAHKDPEVWKRVMDSYINAGFVITSAIPLSTENINNIISIEKTNIFYSLIITARKRKEEKIGFLDDIKKEVKQKIKEKIPKFREFEYNQGEMLQASIGIALEVITSYSEIKSFKKEESTKTAIDLAQTFLVEELIEQDLEKYGIKDYPLDPETMIYFYALQNNRYFNKDNFNQIVKALKADENEMFNKNLIELRKDSIYFKNAFERADFDEENGKDTIEGNSVIDWIHRAVRMHDRKPRPETIVKISEISGIPRDILSKLMLVIRDHDKGREGRVAGEMAKSYEEVYGPKKPYFEVE